MSGPVADAYSRLLAAGELKADPDQARAAAALDRLGEELAMRRGFFARLLGRRRVRGRMTASENR